MGTYAPAKGIYSFLYGAQKDAFVKTDLFYPAKNAKYLSYCKNRLAFPTQLADARLCVLANGRELLTGLENSTACHVVQDEDCVYTVNYHDGTLICYRFSEGGPHEESTVHIQHEASTYQAVPTGVTILAPCRLLDRVYVYKRTSMELICIISFPKGTGIRHGVLDDHGRSLYIINEGSCEVFEMNMEQDGVITRKLSLLREEERGGDAAIRIGSNGETLYVSVCEVNQLYVIDITQWRILQHISSGGDHPRDINLSPQGNYLFMANRSDGNLVALKIDHISEMLEEKAYMNTIPEGVSTIFYEQEETCMRTNNIGMVGLAIMDRSPALNMAGHGYKVDGHNRSYAMTEHMLEVWPHEDFTGHSTPEELVASLKKPRKVMLMVKAGKVVDAIIEQLIPLLEQGDIMLDGGNSFSEDTIRREVYLKGKGLHYLGVGISGGGDSARFGPSIMPGGDRTAYREIRPILEAAAAWVRNGTPCCTYIGENDIGHYVKMVHNDIEYTDIQLIAEAYLLLKHVGRFDNAQLAEIFSEYRKRELNSFLIHVTSDISHEQDDKDGEELVDYIRDAAQQKGTGRWTSIEALKQGMGVSMIAAAGNTRIMSNNENRKAAEKQYPHIEIAKISNSDALKEEARQGLYAVKTVAYTQDSDLLKWASVSYGWELPLGETASVFRAGYIIQARFLSGITRAYKQQADLSYPLLDSFFQERVVSYEKSLWQIGAQIILSGIPVPATANVVSYLDLFCATHTGANLVQIQHDCSGMHIPERVDEEGSFHHEWRRWTQSS